MSIVERMKKISTQVHRASKAVDCGGVFCGVCESGNSFYQFVIVVVVVVVVIARFIYIKFTSKRLIIKVVAADEAQRATSNIHFHF